MEKNNPNTLSHSIRKDRLISTILLTEWYFIIKRYEDSVDNSVQENSSVFSLIRMRWLPSPRACGQ